MQFTRKLIGVAITACGVLGLLLLCFASMVHGEGLQRGQAGVARPAFSPGQINTEYSRAYIHVGRTGLGHEHGVEGHIKEGAIHFGAGGNTGQIVFDMTTFTADTPTARKVVGLGGTTDESTRAKVNANMRGPHVLDVNRFPTALYEIHSARPLTQEGAHGAAQWEFSGDFTLHGTKRPLQVAATVERENGWLHIRGPFAILQSQYGMKPYTAAFGAIGVADRLEILGDLWVAPSGSMP